MQLSNRIIRGQRCRQDCVWRDGLMWRVVFTALVLSRPLSAFQTGNFGIPRTKSRTFNGSDPDIQKFWHRGSIRMKRNLEDVQVSENLETDRDRIRRRQLLFSMLGAASTTALGKTTPAKAVDSIVEPTSLTPEVLDILKPPLDERNYVAYALDNGLRVLLCSDASSTEAAAAMDVHVGSFADPKGVPGLAHFNEHMLFLGTKKYPQEDSFEKFLSANGGSSNAYTASEDTVYYFDIEAEAGNRFAEALSRFGSFFTSPLFTPSATGRELNAIDSENAKNLQSDSFRVYQLTKARTSVKHPSSKFSTGNKKTLLDDTKRQGIDLREQLVQFYNRYYSANQMTLAVVGPQPISELKTMVKDSFAEIPNRSVGKPELSWAGISPFNSDSKIPSLKHVVEAVPVQDLRQISLSWPFVYGSEQDKIDSLLTKPSNYVAHLLGHEGPGSLLSYLKRQNWATSLASSGELDESDFETFEATVGLTTQGLENVDKVTEAIFSYISLLRDRDIPDYVFDEVLQLDELQWRFLSKGSAGNYVQSLAPSMQKFDPTQYIAGPRRLALAETDGSLLASSAPRSSFSSNGQLQETKKKVGELVSRLSVDNVIVTVLSKTFQGKTDQKEFWYGTDYSVRPIPETTLLRWKNCASPQSLKIDFPKPNQFIPTESGLIVKKPPPPGLPAIRNFESRMEPIPPPKLLREDERWTVHFKQDNRFGQPKAFAVFQLLTPNLYSSPKQAILSDLYALCISDKLGEYAYDAELAGLSYDVKVLPRGIRMTFGGYNEKLLNFATYISMKVSVTVKDILPKTNVEFDSYMDQINRVLSAFDVKQPYSHASYYSSLSIMPLRFQYDNKELRDAAAGVTLQDLKSYVTTLWSSGKGEALIQGNIDESEASQFIQTVDKTLGFKEIPASEIPTQLEPLSLPVVASKATPTRLVIAEPNAFNENSASHVTLQSLGTSAKDHVLIELINAILSEPFYKELRTERQLGYIVSSGIQALGKTRKLAFVVQSNNAKVETLTTEIFRYLDSVQNRIEKLPRADFGTYVKGLIDRKTEPDKQLALEVMRNWLEISSHQFQFDRVQKEAGALLTLEKEDLIEFWEKIYLKNERRVLITEVIPQSGVVSSPLPPKSMQYGQGKTDEIILGIDDIKQFRQDLDTSTI